MNKEGMCEKRGRLRGGGWKDGGGEERGDHGKQDYGSFGFFVQLDGNPLKVHRKVFFCFFF